MALRGADLTLAAGERLLVAGPNGSGKSTLLRVVTGDQAVLAGRVEVGGAAVHAMDDAAGGGGGPGRSGSSTSTRGATCSPSSTSATTSPSSSASPAPVRRWRATAPSDPGTSRARAPAPGPTSAGCRAARRSGSPSAPRWPTAPRSCWPTSRPASSTRTPPPGLRAARGGRGRRDRRDPGQPRPALGRLRRPGRPAARRPARRGVGAGADGGRPGGRQPRLGAGPRRAAARPGPGGRRAGRRARTGRPAAASARDRTDAPVARSPPRSDPPAPGAALGTTPLVGLRGVEVGWGGRSLFDDLDLDLRPGTWTALRGPSGSGKSTLLTLVAGLADPRAGRVEVGGTAWAGLDRAGRATHRQRWLAYGLQRANLVETMTVAENVALAAGLRDRPWTTRSSTPSSTGSASRPSGKPRRGPAPGGERQRASLARVLVSGPRSSCSTNPPRSRTTSRRRGSSPLSTRRPARGATVLVALARPRRAAGGRDRHWCCWAEVRPSAPETTSSAWARSAG